MIRLFATFSPKPLRFVSPDYSLKENRYFDNYVFNPDCGILLLKIGMSNTFNVFRNYRKNKTHTGCKNVIL